MSELPEMRWYGFDGEPISSEQWQESFLDPRRQVGDDDIDGIRISTVWLGQDLCPWIDGPPIIFETMCFGGPVDQEPYRCATWEQAQTQHEAMVTLCLLYSNYPASIVNVDVYEFIAIFPRGVSREEYLKAFLESVQQESSATPPLPSQSQGHGHTESTAHKRETGDQAHGQ